jgi:hypothetical protein
MSYGIRVREIKRAHGGRNWRILSFRWDMNLFKFLTEHADCAGLDTCGSSTLNRGEADL